MTDTNVAIISNEELAKLAKETGASNETVTFLPQLKLNYKEETEDGKELKKGLFYLDNYDQLVLAKTVTFRPLSHHFQWATIDPETKKFVNKTRLVTDLRGNDEPRDEKGTVRCGKPPSKDLKDNKELKKLWRDTTCYRQIQGYVSYTGKTPDGDDVEVNNVLCGIRNKKANFSHFEEEYKKKLGKGVIWDHEIEIYATKEKMEDTIYWIMHYDRFDSSKRLPLLVPQYEALKEIKANVDDFNKSVDTKYYNALHGKADDAATLAALKTVGGMKLDADFDEDDDIPF